MAHKLSHSPNPDLATVTEATRKSGLSPATLYRWIAAKRLRQFRDGRVSLLQIERLKAGQRAGRPHGLSQLEKLYLVRDAGALAAPFLSEQNGFALFEAVASQVALHHAQRPGGRQRLEKLLSRLYVAL